jgi:hypothetical protein
MIHIDNNSKRHQIKTFLICHLPSLFAAGCAAPQTDQFLEARDLYFRDYLFCATVYGRASLDADDVTNLCWEPVK